MIWRRTASYFAFVVFLAMCLVVASSIVAKVQTQRDAVKATTCQGNLSCIGMAMHDYHQKYGHFPPAFIAGIDGKPAHSWRVLLLEFLDPETFRAYRFDELWNSPNNQKLQNDMPTCYSCPADEDARNKWHTNYFVVAGAQTVFPGANSVKINDIQSPHSETILLIESVGQGVHWMEPKDLSLDSMSLVLNDDAKPSVSSKHRNGPNVCMVDVTKLRLSNAAPETLKAMLLVGPVQKKE